MPDYAYTGNTKQQGANHPNEVVAMKVDLGGAPIFEVLAEATADASGNFTLNWGTTYSTAEWAGRIIVISADDDETVKLDCIAHDHLTGTLV